MRVFRRGKVWWGDWFDGDRRVRRSLDTTDKQEAERKLEELAGANSDTITVSDVMREWLASKLAGTTKQRSREVYALQCKRFTMLWGELPAEDFDASRVDDFKHGRLAAGRSPVTINQDLVHFKAALRLAAERGRIKMIPQFSRLRYDQDELPKELDDDELRSLLDTCRDPARFKRLEIMLRLALEGGLRAGEIIWLQWRDIELKNADRALIHVRRKQGWSPKGRRNRKVPIRALFARWLKERQSMASDWVAPQAPGKQWDRRYVTQQVAKLFRAAGVEPPEGTFHRLHLLRSTFACRYLRNGGDLYSLKEILGHRNIKTTAVYLAANDDSQRRGLQGLELPE